MQDRKKEGSPSHASSWFSMTNVYLALSKAALVVPTQPMQVIMRRQQASLADKKSPKPISIIQTFKLIMAENARVAGTEQPAPFKQKISAFFKGGGNGAFKEFIKNGAYKAPLITGAPKLAGTVLSSTGLDANFSERQYYFIRAFVAGNIASIGDNLFGGIFERRATYLATLKPGQVRMSLFQEALAASSKVEFVSSMYKGFVPATAKSSVAFVTFYAVSDPIKEKVKKWYGVKPGDKETWTLLLTTAALVGASVATTSSPLDIIKTGAQMAEGKKVGLMEGLRHNYKAFGLVGMTAGLPMKFLLVVGGWALTYAVTQSDKVKHVADHSVPTQQGFGLFRSPFKAGVPEAKPTVPVSPKPSR